MSSTPKPPASPREFSPSLLDLGTLESLDSLPRAGQRSAEFSASLLDLGTPASLDCLPRAGLRAASSRRRAWTSALPPVSIACPAPAITPAPNCRR